MASSIANNHHDTFNLDTIAENFARCIEDIDKKVDMSLYISAFEELNKFFHHMGRVFTFVASDIHEKCTILTGHLQSDVGTHYSSIRDMVDYEVSNSITVVHDRHKLASGCRTLLRLHRALKFIIEFLDKLSAAALDDHVSSIGHKAYDTTLRHYHPWLVRQAVGLAMYALPNVHGLAKIVAENNGHQLDHSLMQGSLQKIVQAAQPVYDVTQEMYEASNLLDLP
ncbi:PREDICTED: ceramide-1-phosphate transfer protein-like [Priapulus caudatus]|uniref:Ceramide-1-phosphate transfer protein-like n=1 Tax=Priapulus caudatus TaxID=37621 RepID=A0ABM1DXA7_PRICU|nr:PREDICTED: ceramide-1-phosphate transfer protein-like [Priapulus caudatus]